MIIKLLRKLLKYLIRRKERKERIAYVRANPHKFRSSKLDKNFNKNFQSVYKKLEKKMRYYDTI